MADADMSKRIEHIALNNASKEDIARIEKMLAKGSNSEVRSPPPSTTTTVPVVEPSIVKGDLEELKKYRESDRQAYLKKLPKKVIEEFKLKEASLTKVKEISTLTQALKKKTVGQETPETDAKVDKKVFGWNPVTQKNEYH